MQRDSMLISVIAVSLLFCIYHIKCEKKMELGNVCGSIDVRNEVSGLKVLENCTIISGSLQLFFLRNIQPGAFDNYTFPKLREISEYLLLNSVLHLENIAKLFPNLTVIRGLRVVNNFAMIISNVSELQEIGLTNLMHVGRGRIIVEKSFQVCYVNTVNWDKIGTGIVHTANPRCPECPLHCDGCWNELTCQRKDKDCHDECYGCTKPNSPDHCLACKNYQVLEKGTCVPECPSELYTHYNSSLCLTRQECLSILNSSQMIYKQECVGACPWGTIRKKDDRMCEDCEGGNCNVTCPGKEVYSLMNLDQISYCQIINGTLSIRVLDPVLVNYLKKGMSQIQEIRGNLVIYRSPWLKSLEFFSNLKVIHGERNNTNNKTNSLIVYDNPDLEYLWDFDKDFRIVHGFPQFYNNPNLCFSEIERIFNYTRPFGKEELNAIKHFNGFEPHCYGEINLEFTKQIINSTNVTIEWQPFPPEDEESVFYTIYYTKSLWKNLTHDGAEENSCRSKWNSKFVQYPSVFLNNLEPYTQYGYFVKIFSGFTPRDTVTYYFTTAPDDPSNPDNFTASAINDTTILLTWEKPTSLNGNFSYYVISPLLERDYLPTLEQIDYCTGKPKKDVTTTISKPKVIEETTTEPPVDEETCNCSSEEFIEEDQSVNYEPVEFDIQQVCNKDCGKYMYHSGFTPKSAGKMKRDTLPDIIYRNIENTTYVVENLMPFSMYIFFIRGCNEHANSSRQLCSGVEMAFARTKRRQTADRVIDVNATIDVKVVKIEWTKPLETNSELLAYTIELLRGDGSTAVAPICLSKKPGLPLPTSYRLGVLTPDEYQVRVAAVSLAGPGDASPWRKFVVEHPGSGNVLVGVLVAVFLIVIIAIAAIIIHYHYKKRHQFDNIHLIASINPDYAGPVYREDEWEIDRNDVAIYKEIGKGSFGLVYEGMIKSRRLPCAIKTVAESASITSHMEFLNEGSVMKAFSKAHHVVKLLGIVSRGGPPLVIMELMDWGDLKTYLKRCREPSRNLTTNELYRMAAEIADGMAYLAAKKFVHRDLATRNCMVAADRTVKVGDFGMARDIYETEYYRKDTVGFLPVRWMAPESLADGVFTSDSDVWSYGVVLWEMATLAELPYQGRSNEEVFHFVKAGGKLERPPECSDLLYEVMHACWDWRPNDRPTFSAIVHKLVNYVGENFPVVSFCFSQEGIDHERHAGSRPYNPPAMSAMLREEDRMYGDYSSSDEEGNAMFTDRRDGDLDTT